MTRRTPTQPASDPGSDGQAGGERTPKAPKPSIAMIAMTVCAALGSEMIAGASGIPIFAMPLNPTVALTAGSVILIAAVVVLWLIERKRS